MSAHFWSLVDKSDDCWVFTGMTNRDGYGRVRVSERRLLAHRYSLELTGVVVPDGMEVDHLCRNRACVNPAHLEVVTHDENMRRARGYKTHCPKGHEYDEVNTYRNRRGAPVCRTCRNEKGRELYHRKKVAAAIVEQWGGDAA